MRLVAADVRGIGEDAAEVVAGRAGRLAEMRAAGTSYGAIARALGISKGEAYDACAYLAKLRAEGEAQTEAESSLSA